MSERVMIWLEVIVVCTLIAVSVWFYGLPGLLTEYRSRQADRGQMKKSSFGKLNTDYRDFGKFNIITMDDIVSGRLAEAEISSTPLLPSDVEEIVWDDAETKYEHASYRMEKSQVERFQKNPNKAPFRNLYYYKLKIDEGKWMVVLGQQWRNKGGSNAFIHYLFSLGNDNNWAESIGGLMPIRPVMWTLDGYFERIGLAREFFSADPTYTQWEGSTGKLIREWVETGVVPEDLQKVILLMNSS